jgi:MFS family permease
MFGAATTLVAESVPTRIRAVALGSLQALSALGNIIGSLISTEVQPGKVEYLFGLSGWRILFFIGILPAILIVPMVLVLREPEAWKAAKKRANAGTEKAGSIPDLFRHPVWRRRMLVGVCLGLAGMAGLWGVGFFSPELISTALKGSPQSVVDSVRGYGLALQDVGSFLGILAFTFVATKMGRRPAFLMAFLLCLGVTIFVFNNLKTGTDAYWMLPLMGFAQLSVFGGYAIYFPELFPTRLRGTGVGFCYNTVRYLAAVFPPLLMYLNAQLLAGGVSDPFRKAATILSFIFVLGIVALIWAPETKGQPLPED